MSYSPSSIREAAARTIEYDCSIADKTKLYELGTISQSSYYKFILSLTEGFIEFEVMGDKIISVKSVGNSEDSFYLGIIKDVEPNQNENSEESNESEEEIVYDPESLLTILISGIEGSFKMAIEYTFEPFNFFKIAESTRVILNNNQIQNNDNSISVEGASYVFNKYFVNTTIETTAQETASFQANQLNVNTLNVSTINIGNWTFSANGNTLTVQKINS